MFRCICLALGILISVTSSNAWADANRIRLSRGYSTAYLPLMVMQDRKLIEKHAQAKGLGSVSVEWSVLDGGNVINDAMLAGTLDIAGIGAPGFITLWARTRTVPASAVIGLSALSGGALWLNTNKASAKSLRDLGPGDKIAVPGIKTSFAAFALQMAVAKEFGIENYNKLDPLTVGMSHPDAYTALVSGRTEITAHFASPPFSYKELKSPNVHRILSTREALGPMTLLVNFAPQRFVNANPKLVEAFLEAQKEASELIAKDKEEAAAIYIRVSGLKMPHDEILALLNDPENSFSLTPEGIMEYARFMEKSGTIKSAPQSWSAMFIAGVHSLPGS